jgi:hypothetical protein
MACRSLCDKAIFCCCLLQVGMELLDSTQWLMSKGLTRSSHPIAWLNGVLIPLPDVTPTTDQELTYKILMEQQKLQV